MLKQRLGISTLTWVSKPVREGIERAAELGFPWVDLGLLQNWSEFGVLDLWENEDAFLSPVQKVLEEKGIFVATLNASLVSGKEVPSVRDQCRTLCSIALRLKVQAGITLPTPSVKESFQTVVEYLTPIYEVCQQMGMPLMVETHYYQWTEKIENTLALLHDFPGLRITLDASHYIIQGLLPKDWESLVPYTGHCHIRPCAPKGWEGVEVPLEEASPMAYEWVQRMEQWGYQGLYGFEIIEGFGVPDTEAASLQMRNQLLQRV